MRPLGEDGEWPAFPNAIVRELSLIPREFRASVPPCTAPAALHFQGDPQTDAAAAAEGLRLCRQSNAYPCKCRGPLQNNFSSTFEQLFINFSIAWKSTFEQLFGQLSS